MNAAYRIGFLGAGQMAKALALGWKSAGLLDPSCSLASDPLPESRARFHQATGLPCVEDNLAVVAAAEVLLLAVKPQVFQVLLNEIRPRVRADQLIISIAAGVTLSQLAQGLGVEARVVRVMPNTPCLVGASASGYALGVNADRRDAELVQKLFSSVGLAAELPEQLLDAVTGLSGSGPAYVAVMIEALADGGVKMGLPRAVALQLAAQTVLGTAKMVLETGQNPAQLKDAVASPGGTTIAGLHALEQAGLRAALMDAVEAATRRAAELGRSFPS